MSKNRKLLPPRSGTLEREILIKLALNSWSPPRNTQFLVYNRISLNLEQGSKKNFSTKIKKINNNNLTSNRKALNSNNKKKVKNIFQIISSYLDISKLYFIPINIFEKSSLIIFFILAILFIAAVIFILISNVDLSNYYSIWSILPPLFMVYLRMWEKNAREFKELCIKGIYMISNLALLSLILALFVYLASNYLFYDIWVQLPFIKSFYISKNILGFCLSIKIVISIIEIIYYHWKEPKILCNKLYKLLSSLIVLAFFYQAIYVICGAILIICDDIELMEFKLEIKLKNSSKYQSELKVKSIDKPAGPARPEDLSSHASQGDDKSLNHHFYKDYPKIVKAKGKYLYTDKGRGIFDACSGAAVASIGYGNQDVIDAMHIKNMSGTHYLASSFWKDNDVLKLQKSLADSTDGLLDKVYLTGSGSDATEAAIKLACQYYYDQDSETQRKYIISRDHSYHGNTLGALSISEFPSRQAPYKGILMSNVGYVSSCNPYRQQLDGESVEDFVAKKADEFEKKILEIGREKVMAFIAEPVSGAALGCVKAVPGYFKAMKNICEKYDILFIADEIMCGLGRTGNYHAWKDSGVVPDILILGKGLGAGYFPVAAILVSPKVWGELKSEQFIHGLTFDAVPTGATVALKVQQIIKDKDLVANVKKVGDYLGKTLKAKLSNHKNVGDIRGEGFFWGVEFVEDKITKKPFDSKLGVSRLIVDCAKSPKFNMTFYPGSGTVDGVNGDHIIIAPPFMTTEEDADHIVEVILTVIEIVFNEINK
nr:hypothetical protein [Annulohypoxylon stygium]